MLILARKVGEKVRIGDNIELTVIEVRGDVVRLGISAPRGIPVHRQEIYEAIQAENKAAAITFTGDLKALQGMLNRGKGGEDK